MADRDQWLASTPERAIEPELPIIDTHHHLWDFPDDRYSDVRRYLVPELAADAAGQNIRQTVFVETGAFYKNSGPVAFRPTGEVEFAQGQAAQGASGDYGDVQVSAGIVGTADLRMGDDVVPVLEALMAASPQRFRGIRQRAAWADTSIFPQPPEWMEERLLASPAFRAGFKYLNRYAMTFDAWVFHPQLADVADLAAAFPYTTVILNHLGTPMGIGPYSNDMERAYQEWKTGIAKVAVHENVVLKVGGIQMPMNGFAWHLRDTAPTSDELLATNERYYSYAIEQFGPGRCLFESNFPVDRQSCSYTVLWNQFKKLTKGYRPDERAAMFHDNALRVYRLVAH